MAAKANKPSTMSADLVKKVVRKVIMAEDYRADVLALIDAAFLEFVIEFFGKVARAKMKNQPVTIDWYKKELLDKSLPSDELILNSGLNNKSIRNSYKSVARPIVLEATEAHYDELLESMERLVSEGITSENEPIEIMLTIKLNGLGIDLTVSESLIVINTIAVKRAAIRGGIWSSLGKQVERPLMETLCQIFGADRSAYDQSLRPTKSRREVDFYLTNPNGEAHKCEVKLMGLGNPESADGAIARGVKVFVFDSIPDGKIKEQLVGDPNLLWVELRVKDGYRNFKTVLDNLGITTTEPKGDISTTLDRILARQTDIPTLDVSDIAE